MLASSTTVSSSVDTAKVALVRPGRKVTARGGTPDSVLPLSATVTATRSVLSAILSSVTVNDAPSPSDTRAAAAATVAVGGTYGIVNDTSYARIATPPPSRPL